MTDPQNSIRIENVLASSDIGQELELESVAMVLQGVDSSFNSFPASSIVHRTTDPKSAALPFRSGKIVCTGAKSVEDVHESMEIAFEKIRDPHVDVEEDPEIVV